MNVETYKNETPVLKIEEYFNGPVKAWGIVQDRSGNVTKRFDITMVGKWQGNKGTLEEHFVFSDGEKQHRVWHITKVSDTHYEGTAGDIIGTATGKRSGNAVQWRYKMDLPVGDTSYHVAFDDWMFLMNDGVLINRSYIKKFGIRMADLTIFMQKQ